MAFCTKCGTQLAGDDRFCASCGTPFSGGLPPTPPQQQNMQPPQPYQPQAQRPQAPASNAPRKQTRIDNVVHGTVEERRVQQNVSIEMIFSHVSDFFLSNGIPVQAEIGDLITKSSFFGKPQETKPYVAITPPKDKAGRYASFGITTDFDYGITHIKLFFTSKSAMAELRAIDGGNNKYTRYTHYIQEWEEELKYIGAVKRAFGSMFE